MLYIRDPYLNEMRDQMEYHVRSEAHKARPVNPAKTSDKDWGDYIFFFANTKGIHFERWVNFTGHRKWFNVIRNTVTDEIIATYRPDEDVVEVIKKLKIDTKDIKVPGVLNKLKAKGKTSAKKAKSKKA
ncbi:MAG: sarcosine oxidase subunit delta [Alphaproteobacteria bacterium]